MPVFYLDDQPIEFTPGEKVLAAALRAGYQIPHYCFHPALSIVATCRMCLVDVVDMGNGRPMPKLQTSCSTDAVNNMRVVTSNEKVQQARNLVMEFLLVNHPLDCPICDQSGECTLQDYSFQYGSGQSEMEYAKRVYGRRDIGTFVTLERNRCIHCTRCERFTSEVTGTHEFGVFNRGHQLTVDTFIDQPMTNKFQGNMADLCPVGCITEKEFRFKRRAWKLKKNESICTGCSTGCNITIDQDENTVFRLKPRENQAVNQWWMCDDGRMTYRDLNEKEKRLMQPAEKVQTAWQKSEWSSLYTSIKHRLRDLAPQADEVVALTDTQATNEELYLLRQWLKVSFQSEQIFFPLKSWSQPQTAHAIDSLITTDKTPNRAGALALGLKGDEQDISAQAALWKAKVVIILGNPFSENAALKAIVEKAPLVIAIGTRFNDWMEIAHVLLPGQTYAEKQGTFTNKNNRVQRINIAIRAPKHTKPEWLIFTELMQTLGQAVTFNSAPEVLAQLAEQVPAFRGLSFEKVGSQGISLTAV